MASQLLAQWKSEALSSDEGHLLANFGDSDASYTIAYNLFWDRLLDTGLISDTVGILTEIQRLPVIIDNSSLDLSVSSGILAKSNHLGAA